MKIHSVVLGLLHANWQTQTEMAEVTNAFLQPYDVNTPWMSLKLV
jgi:hypothetical protein